MVALHPPDVRLLEWTDKVDFGRVRAKWLQCHRWDTALSPSTMVVLAEIAGRMSFNKDFAWPSIRLLAAELGWSEPTVKRAIAQAIKRGWLICEKRSFSGVNHYEMAASAEIAAAVAPAHKQRIALVMGRRATSLRSEMIPIAKPINEVSSEPSERSELRDYSGQYRSLDETNLDPLISSLNSNTNHNHRSDAERLDGTEEDETQPDTAISDALEGQQLRRVMYLELGSGDMATGRRYARALGSHRTEWLLTQIRIGGVHGAGDALRDAADAARRAEMTLVDRLTEVF